MTRIGILGGTLDPIHCGHLAAAAAARDAFALSQVFVVPSHVPPHRPVQPVASPFHRFAMAALAVSGRAGLAVSDDELRADGPSYTAETLDRWHARGYAASQIFFITGADAFAEIATWRRYPGVLDLANFVVVSRPGHEIDALAGKLPALAPRIRSAAAPRGEERDTVIWLLQAATPDVSSTGVRERVRHGESITGLVPPSVEAHILHHHLYSTFADRAADNPADQLHGQN
ncbi:MAG TPA: nicotinate-nucleotide adenylyltransferase [Vicinamibacterales bacterium]|nr:nicotinate-nucleotide adenylyltransferase [Vicinamibacterales bacterium]